MSVPFGGSVTVRRRVRGAPDSYGNDTWTVVEESFDDCAWWDSRYGAGTERLVASDTVVSGLTLTLPYGTAIDPTDQVVIAGITYDVDGEPGQWRSPLTGLEAGTVIDLRRVTG